MPGMKLLFGATQLGEVNGTKIAPVRELIRNKAGIGTGFKWRYTIECAMKCSSQADCKTKMDAVEAALATPNQDLVFQNDDGTSSTNSVLVASVLGGQILCVSLSWDPQPGGQFQTWRNFSATFEWETIFGLTSTFLVDFEETVTIDNPPSRFVVTEAVNGVTPIARVTVLYPKSTGAQFGFAVGLKDYPELGTIAPPLFPTTPPLKSRPYTKRNPMKVGPSGNKEYRLEWRYEYESPTALAALPPHTW
jgi:hypothetical protein